MRLKAEMDEIFFNTDKYLIGVHSGGIIMRINTGSGDEKDCEFELTWDELYEWNTSIEPADPYNYELPAMKVKEPKWPKYRNILMGSSYTVEESSNYNEAIDACRKAWQDANKI